MSRKKQYIAQNLKLKLVLEILKGERTLNEISSENNIIAKNLKNWKAKVLKNEELAMERSKAVKEYKDATEFFHILRIDGNVKETSLVCYFLINMCLN